MAPPAAALHLQMKRGLLVVGLLWASPGCKLPAREIFEEPRVQRGAVVSEHPLATAAGLEILRAGGNAADAAVATALALAVCLPRAGNLGGGGFAVCAGYRDEPQALDFREVAPGGLHPELYFDEQGQFVPGRAVAGPLSIGVPGSPLGLHTLFQEKGSKRVSWAKVLEPAIDLARNGFEVDPWLARDLGRTSVRDRMNGPARAIFYPGGQPLRQGELLIQGDLARTLEAYSSRGPEAFYTGPVAEALVQTLARERVRGVGADVEGAITLDDLAAYEVLWRAPLVGRFQGSELITMPPPSSGGLVILQALAILEGLPLGSRGPNEPAPRDPDELLTHWSIEALRLSFADRAEHMGDPDFHQVPVAELLSAEWVLERRTEIGPRANPGVSPWAPPPVGESDETTHLSVVDERGFAVSLTTTLNSSFGSGLVVEGAGFLLNNELDDFAIKAGVPNQFGLVGGAANALVAGKRPLSSMSPTIVRDGRGAVRMVLGSPGGPRIISAVFQVLLRVLVLDQGLAEAVGALRLHQQWRPEASLFEGARREQWDPALLDALRQRGHQVKVTDRTFGSVQAILIDNDGWPAATSDPRRGGAAGVVGWGVQASELPPN